MYAYEDINTAFESSIDVQINQDFPHEFALELIREFDDDLIKKTKAADNYIEEFLKEEVFEDLIYRLKKQFKDIFDNTNLGIIKDDPILYSIDAFSVIEWGLKEVPHTKMLGFFLDPKKKHCLGTNPLKFLLIAIEHFTQNNLFANNFSIQVNYIESEKNISRQTNEEKRLDVYVKLIEPKLRLIIEAKVESKEGDKQLEYYEKWAEDTSQESEQTMLIYLTKRGEKPLNSQKWDLLSWKQVAIAFCALIYDYNSKPSIQKEKHGLELLSLWTSTLLHSVCNIKKPEIDGNDQNLSDLITLTNHITGINQILELVGGKRDEGK